MEKAVEQHQEESYNFQKTNDRSTLDGQVMNSKKCTEGKGGDHGRLQCGGKEYLLCILLSLLLFFTSTYTN